MSSIGTMAGLVGSAAGTPLSQTVGAATERAQKDYAAVERSFDADAKADQAAGIGQAEEDAEADERDADGRRFWERRKRRQDARLESEPASTPQGKDATGGAGNTLDLIG